MSDHEHGERSRHEREAMAVAVITPSGTFPNDDDYRRTYGDEIVGHILTTAAQHLRLTNTNDWVAFAENRPLDVNKSFTANDLSEIVEVEWHKHEGGGGA